MTRDAGRDPSRRRALGREAEDLAASYLGARGFTVVARNHAVRRGEVDLVCREGEVLCFVEVRSRSSSAHGGPEETIDRRKARRVVAAAHDWMLRNGGADHEIRFDVVAVTFSSEGLPRVEHFRGAFDADGGPAGY